MKKILFVLLIVICLTGCSQKESHFDDIEFQYSQNNNELKCTKEDDDIKYRVWAFQDPKTYAMVRETYTIDKSMQYYDLKDEQADADTHAWLCSDYDREKFSDCEIERYMANFKKSSARVKAKYTYYLLEDEGNEDEKDLLKEIQKILEEDKYTCELNMK